MFEYHGWATISPTPDADIDEALLERTVERVGRKLAELSDQHFLDLRWMNGYPSAHMAGFISHRGTKGQQIINIYKQVARLAPGSYGLLYVNDDEDAYYDGDFRVYRMARGHITEHADPFLSPIVPTVQDEYLVEAY